MNRKLVLAMAVILIGFASSAFAIVGQSGNENQQQTMVVKNASGESVGTVTNALVDGAGNIAFIIVAIDDGTGQGHKEIAVPTSIFSYDHENETLILNMTKEELSDAPEFNASQLSDPSYAMGLYQHYGLAPSFTE